MNQWEAKICLSRMTGLGSKRMIKLLEKWKTEEAILRLTKRELKETEGIGEKLAEEILNRKYRDNVVEYSNYMKSHQIELLSITEEEYPTNLKQIYDPPAFLYVKGGKQVLSEFAIGMVGCREASGYGKTVSKKIAWELAKQHIVIISGLARGIDTYSHIGCLLAKEKTIAVLGNGLDSIYPSENRKLSEAILSYGGAIVSEYPLGTPPNKMNFPARNRIISGLSEGIVVVEAKKKSGSMITVDFALEEGKSVFAVPGNISSATSEGTNEAIKQGAKLITCVEDILEEYR